jgi:hypothetical protein
MGISKFRFAVPAAVCAVVLGLSGGSASALTANARVRPARGLTTGQVVKVHWHAFDPTQDQGGLVILQCTPAFATDGMQTHCDLTNPVNVSTATARGSAAFTVHTGNIGDGTCGTSATDLHCVIAVIGIGVPPPTDQTAVANITFAPPA